MTLAILIGFAAGVALTGLTVLAAVWWTILFHGRDDE